MTSLDNMTSPVFRDVKKKILIGILGRAFVMFLFVAFFWVYYFEEVTVANEAAPIIYGFYGMFGLIFVLNVATYLWRMRKLLGLVKTMNQISRSYGMEFVTDKKQLGKKLHFKPMECLIRGKRSGKNIVIYPAMDVSRGSGNKAQNVTVFERPLGRNLIPISVVKNSGLMSFVGGLMGGQKVLFRNDYLILAPSASAMKWVNGGLPHFKSNEEWQAAVLAQADQIFPSDAMGTFDMLPGRKGLLVANDSVLLIVTGYVQDLNVFEKYLTFMERLS